MKRSGKLVFMFFSVVLIISFFLYFWFLLNINFDDEDEKKFEVAAILIVPTISFLVGIFKKTWDQQKKPYTMNYHLKKSNPIRISFSYLIRVKIDSKYLMIYSKKNDMYQPIGGVYQFESSVKTMLKEKFDFQPDSSHRDKNDFRALVSLRKLDRFIKWFDKNENRETTPYREFYEEVIKTGLLDPKMFNNDNLSFSKIKTFYQGIQFSPHYSHYELLRFDLYELELNDEQENNVRDVLAKDNANFELVTNHELSRLGVGDKFRSKYGTQSVYLREEVYYDKKF